MPPRLTVISGPWKNTSFPVTTPLSIGSDPSTVVRLEDPAVAPQHCSITESAECFTIRDLDSPAGTYVNGIPICERVLSFGDQITIGDSSFLFLPEAATAAESSSVQLDEQDSLSGSAQQLKPDDLLYLQPESLAALPPAVRLARRTARCRAPRAGFRPRAHRGRPPPASRLRP